MIVLWGRSVSLGPDRIQVVVGRLREVVAVLPDEHPALSFRSFVPSMLFLFVMATGDGCGFTTTTGIGAT